jgi:uncharacterized small protein (DUF1192 family)
MSDINELNEKIAELEKQRDALAEAEKTGGFKVGDKVVIEGVVSEIEASWNYPIKVKTGSVEYGYFRPDNLRHADTTPDEPVCWANFYRDDTTAYTHDSKDAAERHATSDDVEEMAVPLYRVPLYASKRIAELEAEVERLRSADRVKHIQNLESKLSAQCRVKKGLHRAICDRNERIAELEVRIEKIKAEAKRWKVDAIMDSNARRFHADKRHEAEEENQDLRDMIAGKNARIALLQDWLAKASAFKSKPTNAYAMGIDLATPNTCDSPDKCCNTKPAEPATTVDGDCDSVTVAPKGVKAEIVGVLDRINVRRTEDPCAVDYALVLAVDAIRSALGYIVELPEPKGQIDFIRPDDVLCARIKTPVIIDGKVQGKCEAMLHLAAALVQAAKGGGA